MARLLVVDDLPMNRELLRAYLERGEHELFEADSGEAAIAIAAEHPPDLVLLDVMMPGLGGFETTRRLKDQAGEIFLPIILLTALSDRESRLRGLRMGADDFVTKPFDFQELSARIKNLLALREKDQALQRRNVALVELNRFKDEMSALIVHDLKDPMSVILSDYGLIAKGLESADPRLREALDDSHQAARRIMRIVHNLLDLTRVEANRLDLHRARVDAAGLLGDIARGRRVLADARRIALEVDADPAAILDVDGDLVARALENMVDNAFRHTPSDGQIQLGARPLEDRVQLRVGNTGTPIPAEARALIFEKFGQVPAPIGRMNLGMGLYFCRLATEAHGGRLWVEESDTLATVFVMELPAP